MRNRLPVLVGALLLHATLVAQSPLWFEVASVKFNRSGAPDGSFRDQPGGRIVARNYTLRNLIRQAYQVQAPQVVGGPDWLDVDRFDIDARAPMANPTREQFAGMVQALLAERFNLAVHRDRRELPVYALVAAASGIRPAIRPSTCATGPTPSCGERATAGRVEGRGITVARLAQILTPFAGRITIDDSGLIGRFDVDLEWTEQGPSLFTAAQEQLGLRFDTRRAPVDVIVVDAASRPSPD